MKKFLAVLAIAMSWAGCAHADVITADQYFQSGRPWIDVRSEGAVGDGATDDRAAIQSALDSCAILAGAGNCMVYFPPGNYCSFTGLSVTSGITVLMGAEPGVQLQTCGHDVLLLTLNYHYSQIVNMSVKGAGISAGSTPTQAAIRVDTSCTSCMISHSLLQGGTYALDSRAADALYFNNDITQSYADNLVIVSAGAAYFTRDKIDQIFPQGTVPAYGSSIAARANSHTYASGVIVSYNGFYLQAMAGGTSGGAGPTLASYGVAVADGTVTWQLLAPQNYNGLRAMSGSSALFVDGVDLTGPYQAGLRMENTGSGAPQSVSVVNTTFGETFQAGISAHDGFGLTVEGSQFNGCINTGCQGVSFNSNWAGEATVQNNTFIGLGYGVQDSAGKNLLVSGNLFCGSKIAGVQIDSNLSDFAVVNNTAGACSNWGANAIGIRVSAGSSDHYIVSGNIVHGATTGISNGGTGTNKFVANNF